RIASFDDEFEVVTLDSLEFDRPELDRAELDGPRLECAEVDDAELDGSPLDGSQLEFSTPFFVEAPPQLDVDAQGAYPTLRNLVLSTGEVAPSSDRRGGPRHGCEIEVEF